MNIKITLISNFFQYIPLFAKIRNFEARAVYKIGAWEELGLTNNPKLATTDGKWT